MFIRIGKTHKRQGPTSQEVGGLKLKIYALPANFQPSHLAGGGWIEMLLSLSCSSALATSHLAGGGWIEIRRCHRRKVTPWCPTAQEVGGLKFML